MATVSKTLEDLEDLLRKVVLQILELPENDHCTVRFPYGSDFGSGSAPGFKRTDNVCFIYVLPEDGEYAQQSHISYRDDGAERLTHIDKHTDIYRVNFVCYGDLSFEWAKAIKAGISMQDMMELLLYRNDFALIPGSMHITPVRDLRDGEWWKRYDLTSQWYHGVRIETENYTRRIEHVKIQTYDEGGT